MASREPAIVAELGRPETAEETAARKAETSRKHRANQTLLNLIVATIASLLVVLFLVVVVVRPDPGSVGSVGAVDYRTIAGQAQPDSSEPLLTPALPPGWYANDARFQKRSQVPTWYIGLVTADEQFIALNQGIDANPTWQATVLNEAVPTGSTTIAGLNWTVFDQRTLDDPGNVAYAMVTTVGTSTILLHGTASTAEFELLATVIAAELEAS